MLSRFYQVKYGLSARHLIGFDNLHRKNAREARRPDRLPVDPGFQSLAAVPHPDAKRLAAPPNLAAQQELFLAMPNQFPGSRAAERPATAEIGYRLQEARFPRCVLPVDQVVSRLRLELDFCEAAKIPCRKPLHGHAGRPPPY